MKKFRILTGALALALVAAIVIACSKEKEMKVAQQVTGTEEAARKSIATFDNATGQMTYHVSVEQLQAAMDNYTASKSVGEVIVESWSIIEDESTGKPALMLSVIEVDTESSSKIAMYNTFVEGVLVGNVIEYYLTDLIRSGNYNYITSDAKDTYFVTVENNEVVSVELYNAKDSWTGGVTVSCRKVEGCTYNKECYPYPQGCSGCVNGKCEETLSETFPAPALSGF